MQRNTTNIHVGWPGLERSTDCSNQGPGSKPPGLREYAPAPATPGFRTASKKQTASRSGIGPRRHNVTNRSPQPGRRGVVLIVAMINFLLVSVVTVSLLKLTMDQRSQARFERQRV